jgi:hypothetical protein
VNGMKSGTQTTTQMGSRDMTIRTYAHSPATACLQRHVDALRNWMSEKSPKNRVQDEAGAVLILALLFLLVVGMITGGLAGWITNDLNNSTQFASARSLQSSASNATELAIQSIRYDPLLATTQNASPPAPCWGTGPSSDVSVPEGDTASDDMSVWCSTKWNPSSASTRVVTISTCLSSQSSQSAATCSANPYLQAIVVFDDYPPGISAPNPNACVVYCGTGMTVTSWRWSPATGG